MGKSVPSNKSVKKGTATTKKFRFQSFNQRISKLKIDPIRRARGHKGEKEEYAISSSHLKTGLESWRDTNLTENFTAFLREVEPYCDSLVQILHYQQTIVDKLMEYIERKDELSLEPLLDLTSKLAHDLGIRFEKHFLRVLTAVSVLAARHTSIEVIEWSFTCLAWLFKYLSRLLVPDLRPVFNIMAPLLGKAPQKLHTARFAAEVMAFLIRKSALSSSDALVIILTHIKEDVGETTPMDHQLYHRGLMTLLADAMKGVSNGLHSNAERIYNSLLDLCLIDSKTEASSFAEIVNGITVNLIHHTTPETFAPILEIILRRVQTARDSTPRNNSALGRLLFVVASVRKGSRVTDWAKVLDAAVALLEPCSTIDAGSYRRYLGPIEKAIPAILHHSPLDVVIPRFRRINDLLTAQHESNTLLSYYLSLSDLGDDRFGSLIKSSYHSWTQDNWANSESEIVFALPTVIDKLLRQSNSQRTRLIECSDEWQARILRRFSNIQQDHNSLAYCTGYISMFDELSLRATTRNRILEILHELLKTTTTMDDPTTELAFFSVGIGLRALLNSTEHSPAKQSGLLERLCSMSTHLRTMPMFLENMRILLQQSSIAADHPSVEVLASSLISNLACPSHELRSVSLTLLQKLYIMRIGQPSDLFGLLTTIEETPIDLQSARVLAMHVRNIPVRYRGTASDPWLRQAVPSFCIGMLTYHLASVWEDAIKALKEMCEMKETEDLITELIFNWLETPLQSQRLDGQDSTEDVKLTERLNEFQCTEFRRLEQIIDKHDDELFRAEYNLNILHKRKHSLHDTNFANAHSQALRVLNGLPQLAEKKSRRLVPLFLQWAATDEAEHEPDASDEEAPSSDGTLQECIPIVLKFGRRDQQDMLNVFSQFINPRVLFRSSKVWDALLELLKNGETALQRAALNCIFAWKVEGINAYKENLMNLLDDARFRDEISVFLQTDEAESTIKEQHRTVFMPILLRLLYGRVISKSGAKGQASKRKAVLGVLARLRSADLAEFVRIATGLDNEHSGQLGPLQPRAARPRKQLGTVNMIYDLIETLGTKLEYFTNPLARIVMQCLVESNKMIQENPGDDQPSQLSLCRKVRQQGLQCLILLFKNCDIESMEGYLPIIFSELIDPRLEKFPIETAQSVSGLLQLFGEWANSPKTCQYLVNYNEDLLPRIIDCLDIDFAKDEVRLHVLQVILARVIASAITDDDGPWMVPSGNMIYPLVLKPSLERILDRCAGLLQKSPSRHLIGATLKLITDLTPFVQESSQSAKLLEIACFLLSQPRERVSYSDKTKLTQIVQHFAPLADLGKSRELQTRVRRITASLFSYYRDRDSRILIADTFKRLYTPDEAESEAAELCVFLNAYSTDALDEPDFETRLAAFSTINEKLYHTLTPEQWRPILHNMLYFVKDQDELVIRSSASMTLRRFVESNKYTDGSSPEMMDLLKNTVLPHIRLGASERSELVRTEFLAVMASLIQNNPTWSEIEDMTVMLAGDDEEASFFKNVLHIQQHRRLRTLRRLAAMAKEGVLRSNNVAHFIMPLLEHFIFDRAEDENANNLAAEASITIGALSECLEWPQYRAIFRRYYSYLKSKPDLEKSIIKLVGVLVDGLSDAVSYTTGREPTEQHLEVSRVMPPLALTLPKGEKLADDLTKSILPPMMEFLHDKDETKVTLRVPMAISVVKLLKLLPEENMSERLPPVLTDICNILRSRAPESRDLTRKTLAEITTLIGPSMFGFVLKELRGALARGYQLHVLSYTVHSILVATSPLFKPGDIDYCLPQIVAVIMDDIFGAIGQEKDADEYVGKMKEVKSNKSYDSMELIAKTATIPHVQHLIHPLQDLLDEKIDLRMVTKLDELLRRIGVGLLRNDAIEDRQILVFCFEILKNVYKDDETGPKSALDKRKIDYRTRKFLLAARGSSVRHGGAAAYKYKLARFALDILRMVLQRFHSLQTTSNLAGFVPYVDKTICEAHEEVQISTFRLLSTIVKVPLKDLDLRSNRYFAEALRILKNSPSINTEHAQAALKFISSVLRDRPNVEIKENSIAYLLKTLKQDLQEPDRQGVTFNFLKSILARKIIITEVYEIMDVVATMMVTDQSQSARDMARSVYFQFILNYPQSKDRLSKQLSFLVKNLDYKYIEGRQSIMEAMHMLLSRVGSDLVQELVGAFFVPLTLVLVNDEAVDCRNMAGKLLAELFKRADVIRKRNTFSLLRTWLEQDQNELLVRVALQVYTIILDIDASACDTELPTMKDRVTSLLKSSLARPDSADWETMYFALQLTSKLTSAFPQATLDATASNLWVSVRKSIAFPHAWVKLAAARLLGIYFADFAANNTQEQPIKPLKGSHGLRLNDEEMIQIVRSSLRTLTLISVNEELANQSVRNLLFLGRYLGQDVMMPTAEKQYEHIDEADEDMDIDELETDEAKKSRRSVLQYIFERLSAALRREPIVSRSSSLIPKTASLQLMAAFCKHLPTPTLLASIETILLPLHNLTDPSIPAPFSSDQGFKDTYQQVLSMCQELMVSLQEKIGTTEYIARLSKVQKEVKARREGRRAKRRIEAVSQPEKTGRDKKRKGEKKKEKRKERSGMYRSIRRGW
ncbi:U3 snoRNP protein [Agyrium rufum]|nr:U3 snoRNP protein [Agyrium rufum]